MRPRPTPALIKLVIWLGICMMGNRSRLNRDRAGKATAAVSWNPRAAKVVKDARDTRIGPCKTAAISQHRSQRLHAAVILQDIAHEAGLQEQPAECPAYGLACGSGITPRTCGRTQMLLRRRSIPDLAATSTFSPTWMCPVPPQAEQRRAGDVATFSSSLNSNGVPGVLRCMQRDKYKGEAIAHSETKCHDQTQVIACIIRSGLNHKRIAARPWSQGSFANG